MLLEQFAEEIPGFCKVGMGYNDKINMASRGFIAVTDSVHLLQKLKFQAIFIDEAHHPLPPGLPGCEELFRFSATHKDEVDFRYSMGEAIQQNALCDYDLTVPVLDEGHPYLSLANLLLSQPGRFRRVLAYCNSIAEAKRFQQVLETVGLAVWHINGRSNQEDRATALSAFSGALLKPANVLVTVQVLGEGVNIPNADTCMFVQPRSSYVSIIQAIGRVLRHGTSKPLAHVILPALAYPTPSSGLVDRDLIKSGVADGRSKPSHVGSSPSKALPSAPEEVKATFQKGLPMDGIPTAQATAASANSTRSKAWPVLSQAVERAHETSACLSTVRRSASQDLASGKDKPTTLAISDCLQEQGVEERGKQKSEVSTLCEKTGATNSMKREDQQRSNGRAPGQKLGSSCQSLVRVIGSPKTICSESTSCSPERASWSRKGGNTRHPAQEKLYADADVLVAGLMQQDEGAAMDSDEDLILTDIASAGRLSSTILLNEMRRMDETGASQHAAEKRMNRSDPHATAAQPRNRAPTIQILPKLASRSGVRGSRYVNQLDRFLGAIAVADRRMIGKDARQVQSRLWLVDCRLDQHVSLHPAIRAMHYQLALILQRADPWEARLQAVEDFARLHNRLPMQGQSAPAPGESTLATWLKNQAVNFRQNLLTGARMKLLLNTTCNYLRARLVQWQQGLPAAVRFEQYCEKLKQFVQTNRRVPTGRVSGHAGESELYTWLNNLLLQGRFQDSKVQKVAAVDPMVETWINAEVHRKFRVKNGWIRKYRAVAEFVKMYGRVPRVVANEGSLLRWLRQQRYIFERLPTKLQELLLQSDPVIITFLTKPDYRLVRRARQGSLAQKW